MNAERLSGIRAMWEASPGGLAKTQIDDLVGEVEILTEQLAEARAWAIRYRDVVNWMALSETIILAGRKDDRDAVKANAKELARLRAALKDIEGIATRRRHHDPLGWAGVMVSVDAALHTDDGITE